MPASVSDVCIRTTINKRTINKCSHAGDPDEVLVSYRRGMP